jgi:hypothetical protein
MTSSISLSLTIILALINAIPVQAQLAKPTNSVQPSTGNASQQPKNKLIFQTPPPPPPPNTGAPGQRRGGGSRGCLNETTQNVQLESKLLIALVPEYSSLRVVSGLTTQQRPTFWFYVPYTSDSSYAKLVIEDEKNQTFYKTSLAQTPGIIGVTLPPTSSPLEIGKQYRWYFNIYCKQNNKFLTSVEGNVQLLALKPNVQEQLSKATPKQQVALYAANGIWYDALTTLANLRRTFRQDTNLVSDWASLLESVDLQNLVTEPILDCCQPEAQTATTQANITGEAGSRGLSSREQRAGGEILIH